MPTKLTLYAKNIAIATSVLEHALAEGCAIEEVITVDPPINGKRKQASQRGKRKRPGTYILLEGHAPAGLRGEAYRTLMENGPDEGRPQQFVDYLVEHDWDRGQARSAISGLQKAQILLRQSN